jgi:hypothetical protein
MPVLDLSRVVWCKSSLSGSGQDCVEVGVWLTSSPSGGSCVDVARVTGTQAEAEHKTNTDRLFLVRDSKDLDGPVLAFTPSEWDAFLCGLKNDDFADLT